MRKEETNKIRMGPRSLFFFGKPPVSNRIQSSSDKVDSNRRRKIKTKAKKKNRVNNAATTTATTTTIRKDTDATSIKNVVKSHQSEEVAYVKQLDDADEDSLTQPKPFNRHRAFSLGTGSFQENEREAVELDLAGREHDSHNDYTNEDEDDNDIIFNPSPIVDDIFDYQHITPTKKSGDKTYVNADRANVNTLSTALCSSIPVSICTSSGTCTPPTSSSPTFLDHNRDVTIDATISLMNKKIQPSLHMRVTDFNHYYQHSQHPSLMRKLLNQFNKKNNNDNSLHCYDVDNSNINKNHENNDMETNIDMMTMMKKLKHLQIVKPFTLPNLDADSNELFIALNYNISCDQDQDPTQEGKAPSSLKSTSTSRHSQVLTKIIPSPTLSITIQGLSLQAIDFLTNADYWTCHHSSSLSLSSSFGKSQYNFDIDKDLYFPNIYIPNEIENHPSSSINNNYLKSNNEPIKLSNDLIETLKKDVLLWNGNSTHSFYKPYQSTTLAQNIVGIRACGIVPMKPKDLFDLLLDSNRVKEYNQYSVGREDIWVHEEEEEEEEKSVNEEEDNNNHSHGTARSNTKISITKVCHGKNKPPLVRKAVPYMTFFHGEELQNNNDNTNNSKGYMMVTRSVQLVDSNGIVQDAKSYASEITIGSTLFLNIEGHDDLTFFINKLCKESIACVHNEKGWLE
mmetsp:Transcript_20028/g.24685  ORF Transcript_20028/g.24685 Transcript_20028/m.24685 type:complete len:681 (-) Transcript_20028:330-2372(-)